MPRLRDEVCAQQPESLFIGDLRELTVAYETNIASLFRRVLRENTTLRRQLVMAGMELPPMEKMGSDMVQVRSSIPPRPVIPLSLDLFRSEECLEITPASPGSKRRRERARSKNSAGGDSEAGSKSRPSGLRISDGQSEYASNMEKWPTADGVERRCTSNATDRFRPEPFIPHSPEGSLRSDGGTPGIVHKGGSRLAPFVNSYAFEMFVSGCIVLNFITEGISAHNLTVGGMSRDLLFAIKISEHVFVSVFTLEFLLKWRAMGLRAFKPVDAAGRSNFADMLLMFFTGVLPAWLVPALALIFHFDGTAGAFKTLAVLRTVRLARLVRVFQRVPLFREAWMLVCGLSDSARTLFWTCVVIFLVTYVFAIVGLTLIVRELEDQLSESSDPADILVLQSSVVLMAGVDQMMFCLVQVLVSDSYHAFTRPILKFIWWSWIYWYAYVAIAVIVLMNLVTAVIVEHAMDTSRENHDHMVSEREAKRNRDIDKMRKLFKGMDCDGSGSLSWEEFSMSFDDPELGKIWKVLDIDQKDAWEMFQLLDDGDGEITINEFIEALHRMAGVAQAKDMYKLHKMVFAILDRIESVDAQDRFKQQAKSGTHGIEFATARTPEK